MRLNRNEQEEMRAGSRFGIAALAAALALAGVPAPAQNSNAPATNTTANPPAETIGPRELRDFNLNGTVTRPAPTTPATTAPAPRPASPVPRTTAPPPETRAAPARDRPTGPTLVEPSAGPPSLPSPTEPFPGAPSDGAPSFDARPGFEPTPLPPADLADDPSTGFTPWLLALLLLGAGAGFYAWRQRSRPGYATAAGLSDALVAPEPAPAPPQRAPPPRAAPPTAPTGNVTTRLRPWLEIEFAPGRCVVEDDKATVQFDIAVFNSGSAPARDVLVEASMFNAGPAQEQEIGAFFAHPVGKGDRVPVIAPLRRVALKSSVSLNREQLRSFEVGGRQLFVPMIGFNALYRWSGGEGQTSASYLVGRDTNSERMAPLRLDLGPRIFRGLGAREHSVRVRK